MMNNDKLEAEWRAVFEKEIKYRGTIRFSNGVYADNRLHQKWIGYKTAKKASQAEIDGLKMSLSQQDMWLQDRAEFHNKAIQKLTLQIEKAEELVLEAIKDYIKPYQSLGAMDWIERTRDYFKNKEGLL